MRRAVLVLLLGLAGCSGRTTPGSPDDGGASAGFAASDDAGPCVVPPAASSSDDAGPTCTVRIPPAQACTVEADGAITTCESLCKPNEYELTCAVSPGVEVQPPSSLHCTIIPLPGPSGALNYCCPCAP